MGPLGAHGALCLNLVAEDKAKFGGNAFLTLWSSVILVFGQRTAAQSHKVAAVAM